MFNILRRTILQDALVRNLPGLGATSCRLDTAIVPTAAGWEIHGSGLERQRESISSRELRVSEG
jgi:hypothetical protein